jgi:hypothetical protein
VAAATWPALVAAAICGAILVLYLVVLSSEQGQELTEPRVVFVAAFLAATALAAAGGALTSSPPIRRACLAAAGTGLVALGFIGILTIGLPLLLAGCLAFWALGRAAEAERRGGELSHPELPLAALRSREERTATLAATVAALAAVAAVAGGLALTS